jgi:hypothetical protein
MLPYREVDSTFAPDPEVFCTAKSTPLGVLDDNPWFPIYVTVSTTPKISSSKNKFELAVALFAVPDAVRT